MRLLDEDLDRACKRITLYLLRDEAAELRDSLNLLLAGDPNSHEHVTDLDGRKEITVCLYDESSIDHFNERSRTLIRFDR